MNTLKTVEGNVDVELARRAVVQKHFVGRNSYILVDKDDLWTRYANTVNCTPHADILEVHVGVIVRGCNRERFYEFRTRRTILTKLACASSSY